MAIGVVGYTNRASGIGMFVWEFLKYLKADSILSVYSEKGQEVWTDRQVTSTRPPRGGDIERYLDTYKPDVVLFMETPFAHELYTQAKKRRVKVVAIPMHETVSAGRLNRSDLMICTCKEAWRKSSHRRKIALFLPIGEFPFRLRTGHTFFTSIGYGGVNDRRQSEKVIKAAQRTGIKLIVRSQINPPYRVDDPNITYLGPASTPEEVFADGDIAILPNAYGGYERTILEAMSSGMPTVTMDADPMNMYQHDPDFLLRPDKTWKLTQSWVVDTTYNEVSVEQLARKLQWLKTIDTPRYSRWARAQAEAQTWNGDYARQWREALCRL